MSFRKDTESKRPRQTTFQKWLPVIGLIIIIGFFGSVMWSSGSYSNAAIMNQYFQPTLTNSSNTESPTVIDNNTITNVKYLEQQYWSAESFYKNKNFPKAVEAYDFVLKNKNNTAYNLENVNFDVAKWNQVLMFLGNKNREKAVEELEKISTSNMSEKYKNNATELKQKLNSFWYGWAN
ncbi:MAG: tol-pal system YbgF family protein [Saprospiraceae bacterium]